MRKIVFIFAIFFSFCSCQRQFKPQPSILEAYKQYQVLTQLKKELRKDKLNLVKKEELIAFAEELAPQDAEIKLIKAAVFRMKGESEKAKLALESAIEVSPTYSPAFSAYGKLLIENGFKEEGKNYCLYAVELNPIDLAGRNCAH